jgi:hypothetical protein
VGGHSETEVEESSFLKKRSKRLLLLRRSRDPGHGRHRDAGAGIKVFCFFSSEKKGFFHFGAGGFLVSSSAAVR